MYGRGRSNLNHDFNAYNAENKIWHIGSESFVTEAVADYASYRIAATKDSDANSPSLDAPFSATAPAGTVRYVMRERGASLALSPEVWADSLVAENAAADAKQARQFVTNKRTREVIGTRQVRYTVKEDDGTTDAFSVDYDPVTGNIATTE